MTRAPTFRSLLPAMAPVIAVAVTSACLISAPTVAMADETPPSSASPATSEPAPTKDQHCVQNLAEDTFRCYESFSDAISSATGSRVAPPDDDPKKTIESPAFTVALNSLESTAGANVVIGIEYNGSGYNTIGGTLIYETPYGCDNPTDDGYDWQDVDITDNAFDNKISSFKNYQQCYTRHWLHDNNVGGPMGGCAVTNNYCNDRSSMESGFNDETSSIQWS